MGKQTKQPLPSQTVSTQQTQARSIQQKQKVKEKSKSKPKPKYWEHLWKVLFIITTAVMFVLSNKIYLFHTLDQFKSVKKGQIGDLLLFGVPLSVLYIALDYLIHFYFDQKVEKYYLRTDKYKQISERKIKSRVIVRWGFNIFYYTVISIVGYFSIKNTSFMPPIFGGNGSIYTLADHRYLDQATLAMQILYYIQFGKHIGRYFVHAFIQAQGSYYQYLLHHSLASFLIVFSYTMDMWVAGIFVCIVHDLSDAVLASCRMHRQYKNRKDFLLNINYVLLVLGWIGLRVFAFGYCCVWAIWYQYYTQLHILTNVQYQVFNLPYIFMISMLTCLWLMHIYWTYYIVESFLGQTVPKKVQHSYD